MLGFGFRDKSFFTRLKIFHQTVTPSSYCLLCFYIVQCTVHNYYQSRTSYECTSFWNVFRQDNLAYQVKQGDKHVYNSNIFLIFYMLILRELS